MSRKLFFARALALALALWTAVPAQASQFNANTKGSFFCLSKVELRWNAEGQIIQDTFVHLFNDYPQDVYIHMYFINGDPPTVTEPGWNRIDTIFLLTPDQPVYWAMSTGTGAPSPAIPPFTILDAGNPPGRPDPEGSGDFVLRGYVVGWAINPANDHQIRWNHLAATATLVNYRDATAWGYNGWHAPVLRDSVGNGEEVGTPGELLLNNVDYAAPYDQIMFNFPSVGSRAYSSSTLPVDVDGDLTLHPASVDLRQGGNGPVLTNAVFEVWNGNENKFSGMQRCINCWDQRTMSIYSNPNNFLSTVLQTDAAWARVDGKADADCVFPPFQSTSAALLGVVARNLSFFSDIGAPPRDMAGYNVTGIGAQFANVLWDVAPGPGTGSAQAENAPPTGVPSMIEQSQDVALGALPRRDAPFDDARTETRGPNPGQRFSSSQPGNLVFVSKVELRWDANNNLIQDTFVHLTNTSTLPVIAQTFFVNGDPPLAPAPGERPHPGWNYKVARIGLTPEQPLLWSSNRGDAALGVPKFTDLDPGTPAGRPDPEGSTDRVLRGFLVTWVVDDHCQELSGSFLMADAILVNYRDKLAWGYNGYHMPNIYFNNEPPGSPSGTPGELQLGNLDEFASAFTFLVFAFPAYGSLMYSSGPNVGIAYPDLTLHTVSADFSANSPGPLTTQARFDVWNMNEIRFTNMALCFSCWDQRMTNFYPVPNWFQLASLQTNLGRARVAGRVNEDCPGSSDEAMLGVLGTYLTIDAAGSTGYAAFGHDLFGEGEDEAVIKADLCGPPCPWDIATPNGPGMDGQVNVFDLLLLLQNWNTNGAGAAIAPPVNIVDIFDLLELLQNWGPCP